MQFNLSALLAAMVLAMSPLAASAEGLSFNIGAVSLYKSNGVDQDDRQPKNLIPAIQGGVDYSFSNGLYVGNWNSTGKFGGGNLEIDLYAGYAGQVTPDLGFDVGYAHFVYPSSAWENQGEIYASLIHGPFTLKATHVPGNVAARGNKRVSLTFERPLTDQISMKAVYGKRNSKAGGFEDYSLGLTYNLGNDLDVSATFSGAAKKASNPGNRNRLVFGVAKGF